MTRSANDTSKRKPAAVRDEFVLRYLPLAESLARRYRYSGQPLDDLIQVASIGLLKAVDRFDSDFGVKFETYAIPTILGEIRRYHRDHGWSVRMPRRLQEHTLLIKESVPILTQNLGRSPSIAEIAADARLSMEEVLEALGAQDAYASLSLDFPTNGDSEGAQLSETLAADIEDSDIADEWAAFLPHVQALTEREREILVCRFYKDWTQRQIAEELGTSQMHVSRLLARTVHKLREAVAGVSVTTPAL